MGLMKHETWFGWGLLAPRAAGDLEIIAQSLYNRLVSVKPIGDAYLVCTLLDKRVRSCTAIYVLRTEASLSAA